RRRRPRRPAHLRRPRARPLRRLHRRRVPQSADVRRRDAPARSGAGGRPVDSSREPPLLGAVARVMTCLPWAAILTRRPAFESPHLGAFILFATLWLTQIVVKRLMFRPEQLERARGLWGSLPSRASSDLRRGDRVVPPYVLLELL